MVGDGQGGYRHGQVSLDGLVLIVEKERAGSQVLLAHPEGRTRCVTARDTRR